MTTEEKLRKYQREVSEASSKVSELEGEKKSILRQWRDDHGLSGLKDAEAFVKDGEKEKEELSDELAQVLRQIEEQYGFE